MKTRANRGERLLSQAPSSSSPGVGKDEEASWALINANYAGAVINPGTPVLADENKTIIFLPVHVPAAIIKEQSEIVWVRTLGREAGIKMAPSFGACV